MEKYKKFNKTRENWTAAECSDHPKGEHPTKLTNDCLILSQGRPLYNIDLDMNNVPSSLEMKYDPWHCGRKTEQGACVMSGGCKWLDDTKPPDFGKCIYKTGNDKDGGIPDDIYNLYQNEPKAINQWVPIINSTFKTLKDKQLIGKTYIGENCGNNTPGWPAEFKKCEKGEGGTTKVHFVNGPCKKDHLHNVDCPLPAPSESRDAANQYDEFMKAGPNFEVLNHNYITPQTLGNPKDSRSQSIFLAEYKYLTDWNDAQWAAFLVWRWDTDLEAYLNHLESVDDDIQQHIFATEIWDPSWREQVAKKHKVELSEYNLYLTEKLDGLQQTITALESSCIDTDGIFSNCTADVSSLQDLYQQRDDINNELKNNPSGNISEFDPRLSWRELYRDKQGYVNKAGYIKNRGWIHSLLTTYHSLTGARGKPKTSYEGDSEDSEERKVLHSHSRSRGGMYSKSVNNNLREEYGPVVDPQKWADIRPAGYAKFTSGPIDVSLFSGDPFYKKSGLTEYPGHDRSVSDLRRTSNDSNFQEAKKFELCRIHPFDRYAHIDDTQFELLHYGITKSAWLTMLYEKAKQKRRESMVKTAYQNAPYKESQEFTTCKRNAFLQKVDYYAKIITTLYEIVSTFASIAKFIESFGKVIKELISKGVDDVVAVDELSQKIDDRIAAGEPVSDYWEQFASDRAESKAKWDSYKGMYDSYSDSVQAGADANAKISATKFSLNALLPENTNTYNRPTIIQFYFNNYLPAVTEQCLCPPQKTSDGTINSYSCGPVGTCYEVNTGCPKMGDPCCMTSANTGYCYTMV